MCTPNTAQGACHQRGQDPLPVQEQVDSRAVCLQFGLGVKDKLNAHVLGHVCFQDNPHPGHPDLDLPPLLVAICHQHAEGGAAGGAGEGGAAGGAGVGGDTGEAGEGGATGGAGEKSISTLRISLNRPLG